MSNKYQIGEIVPASEMGEFTNERGIVLHVEGDVAFAVPITSLVKISNANQPVAAPTPAASTESPIVPCSHSYVDGSSVCTICGA